MLVYQVDAFTQDAFSGNPAAVCLLNEPADEAWMQKVAAEMNLSDTAFVTLGADQSFPLRWFTPTIEVDLCGHATLAAAHVLREIGVFDRLGVTRVEFETKSGQLSASLAGDRIELDFPATPPHVTSVEAELIDAVGVTPMWTGASIFDLFLELPDERAVRDISPDLDALTRGMPYRGIIVTTASSNADADFVSRFFAPGVGVPEDPVTGSAHCALAPFWAERFGRTQLRGYQASTRGGVVDVTLRGDRVGLAGHAVTVFAGELSPSALPR